VWAVVGEKELEREREREREKAERDWGVVLSQVCNTWWKDSTSLSSCPSSKLCSSITKPDKSQSLADFR
jgi:hypothetical protein